MTQEFTFTIERMIGGREAELDVTYRVIPGCPERGPTYDCGGTPAEDDDVEIVSITHDGQPVTLSDAEEEELVKTARIILPEDMAEAQADAADYLYQARRDRLMTEAWERGNERF